MSGGLCKYCGADYSGDHFCSHCRRIQPVAPGTDYFSFLGLPRKLNLDEAALQQEFYALSRQFHPDYFMGASDLERQASVERSSMLNDAYRTLSDPVTRAQYLLTLEGYREAEKKAPPELLEEVFELNMQIEELKGAQKDGDVGEVERARASLEEALAGLTGKLDQLDQRLFALFDAWDSGRGREVLDKMNELLSQRSYVRNLVRDLKEEIG